MSIGPTLEEEQQITVGRFDRINRSIKKSVDSYFQKPIFYLFYLSLGGTMISLFLNRSLTWEFYLLLGILAILNFKSDLRRIFHGKSRSRTSHSAEE